MFHKNFTSSTYCEDAKIMFQNSAQSLCACMEMYRRSSLRLRKALGGGLQTSYKVLHPHTKYVLQETVLYATELALALKKENYVNQLS